jgi:hypothetical protein
VDMVCSILGCFVGARWRSCLVVHRWTRRRKKRKYYEAKASSV